MPAGKCGEETVYKSKQDLQEANKKKQESTKPLFLLQAKNQSLKNF